MKSAKKQELKSELHSIWNILLLTIQCYEYSYYLYYPKRIKEKEYITNSFFFDFTRHIYWRVTIIELSKLIVDNKETQKYNIHHFLNKLKKNGHFGKLGFEIRKIDEWETLFNKNSEVIKEIESLRNKIYSHTDRNIASLIDDSIITFEKVETIINIIGNIITKIGSDLLNEHIVIKPLNVVREKFSLINILVDEKEKRTNKIVKDFIESANKNK